MNQSKLKGAFKEALFGSVRRLAHTKRYSTLPIQSPETVDAHTFHTAFYAMMIANHIYESDRSIEIDWRFLMSSVLVHDIDESSTGDILRHVKRHTPELQQAWSKMCSDSVREISDRLELPVLHYYWKNDKNPEKLEGCIIELADFLSVYSYAYEQVKMGNKFMEEPMIGSAKYIYEHSKKYASDSIMSDIYSVVLELIDLDNVIGYEYRFDKLKSELLIEFVSDYSNAESYPKNPIFPLGNYDVVIVTVEDGEVVFDPTNRKIITPKGDFLMNLGILTKIELFYQNNK